LHPPPLPTAARYRGNTPVTASICRRPVYNIPPSVAGLPEGTDAASLPPGARQGLNDWKREGWGGPCPPVGRHRYFFKLYALDTQLPDLGLATKKKVLQAMVGHVLAEAELVGTYQH